MATNLSQLVAESNKSSKAVRIGYSVNDTYDGVLSQLQLAYKRMINQNSGTQGEAISLNGSMLQPIFVDRTKQGSITDIGMAISEDGFVTGAGNDYTKYRQQQVLLGSFMSYVLDIDKEDGKGKVPHFVPYKSPRQKLNCGESCTGKNKYPAVEPQSGYKDDCTSMAKGLGNENKPIQIGIAVDLKSGTGTVDAFFKKCYPDIYKDGCGGKLAAKGALMAEIAFVNSSGSAAPTLHAKVIADSGESDAGKIHTIYLPVPLLLTNDYNTLAKVEVKDAKGNVTTVGSGTCSFPLKSSRYNHKEASIESFTPKYIKSLVVKDDRIHSIADTKVTFTSKSIDTDGTTHEIAYVRFYLQEGIDIKGVFSTDNIPAAYQKEIYKGLGEINIQRDIIGYSETINGIYNSIGDITDMEKYVASIVPLLNNKLTATQIARAEALVAKWEAGGKWDAWTKQDAREGVSCGRHQMSAKSGKIYTYLKLYRDKYNGLVSEGFLNIAKEHGKYNGSSVKVYGNAMWGYESEFRALAATEAGRSALMEIFFTHCVPGAVEWFKKLGCDTALELSSLIGAFNHWPGGMKVACRTHQATILLYKDNRNKRAELVEKLHMAANMLAMTYGVKPEYWTQANYRTIGLENLHVGMSDLHTWRKRHAQYLKYAKEGRFDL